MPNTILNGKEISINASVDKALLLVLNKGTGARSTVPGVGRTRMRRIRLTLDQGFGGKR